MPSDWENPGKQNVADTRRISNRLVIWWDVLIEKRIKNIKFHGQFYAYPGTQVTASANFRIFEKSDQMKSSVAGIIVSVCFFLFLLPSRLHAENPVIPDFPKNIFSINLVTPFDVNFPRYRFGYLRLVAPKLAVGGELGIGSAPFVAHISSGWNTNEIPMDYRLWEVRTEARFFMAGTRKHVSPYIAAELFYIHSKQSLYDKAYIPENAEEAVHYDRADFVRKKSGTHIKAGILWTAGPHVAFEVYAGAGFRIRNNSFYNLVNPQPGTGGFTWDSFTYHYFERTLWNINVTFGLKLDFMF